MKKLISYLFLPVVIFAVIIMQDGFEAYDKKQVSEYTKARYASKAKNFFGYWEWLNKIRANPVTGKIDYKAYNKARSESKSHKLSTKRSLTMDWKDLGPGNHGGRTRAFIIDRNNDNILYAGGVAGGLWTSDDAGYNWKQVTGFDGYATVASICQTKNGDIYVGTGEGNYDNFGFAAGGLPGNGVYKSTDGGVTFSHLTSTAATLNSASSTWSHVNRLAADPNDENKVYAATEKGVRVTTDGGSSWSLINMDVSSTSPAMDIDISNDGNIIVASVTASCYLSTDAGANFNKINGTGGFPNSGIKRAEFAIAPSDNNYIYAGIADGGGALKGIYQSSDAGQNWSLIGPGGSQSFKPYSNSAQSQGTYDNALGVALDDPEKIFVGGVGLYSWTPTDGWNKIATLSDGNPTYYVHADMHYVQPHPTNPNLIYFMNDGGVFVTYDGGVTFAQMTHGYRTMQMYSVAVSDSGNVVGGLQDNGTQYIDYSGPTNSSSVKLQGGDGGYVAISWTMPNAYYAATPNTMQRSSNYGSSFATFWDKHIDDDDDGEPDNGANFVTPFKLWESSTPKQDTIIEAVLPSNPNHNTNNVVYDTIVQTIDKPNMFFAGLNDGVWMTKESMNYTVIPEWFKVISHSGAVEAIDVSSDGDVVFVGVGNGGKLYRATGLKDAIFGYRANPNINLDGVSDGDSVFSLSAGFDREVAGIKDTMIVSTFGGRIITSISIDRNDANHVVVGLGNWYYSQSGTSYIYESTNALSDNPTFTAINGSGMLESPVYSLEIDMNDPSIIYAGTEFGVYATENGNGNGSSTTWDFVGPEKVPVFAMEQVDLTGNLSTITGPSLFLGTHGRGYFAHNFDPCEDRGFCTTSIEDNVINDQAYRSINVYPNPMTEKGFISLDLKSEANIKIDLFDMDGKLIKNITEEKRTRGIYNYEMDLFGLKGLYFVNTLINGKEHSNKIIVF